MTAGDGLEAKHIIKDQYFDLIISDIDMPRLNGIDFYKESIKNDPEIGERLLYFTGSHDEQSIKFLKEANLNYLIKPSSMKEIRAAAARILKDPSKSM